MLTPITPRTRALLKDAVLAASLLVPAARTVAQPPAATPPVGVAPADTAYTPSMEVPNGRQVVAVYIGATTCGPCRRPETKAAIARMKPLVAAHAKQSGAAFSAMVVSLDWDLKGGLEFVQSLGAFDEYVFGASWVNTAAQRFFWSDSLAAPSIPQVIVFERTVKLPTGTRITIGPDRMLRRVVGDSAIRAWVRAGAPISRSGA